MMADEDVSMEPAGGEAAAFSGGGARGNAGRRNRTNYRCSKCGQPKRGHVCPYQPRVLRADGQDAPDMKHAATQAEFDEQYVIRHLTLEDQGLPESYAVAGNVADVVAAFEAPPPPPPPPPPPSVHFGADATTP